MNFFGHAVVASWYERDPEFLLGAMLPDLAPVSAARAVSAPGSALERGVAFHLATDRCFHQSGTFRALEASALRTLAQGGVSKGPRRAAAHVGVELLIDGVLARDPASSGACRAALSWGARAGASARDATWLPALCERLLAAGAVEPRGSADVVARRLVRLLARRPRLRLAESDEATIVAWARAATGDVERGLPTLAAELRAALANEPCVVAASSLVSGAPPLQR